MKTLTGKPNLVVDTLIEIIQERRYADKSIPDTVKVIIEKDYWRSRTPDMPIIETRQYKTFVEFCEDNRPFGLGTDFDLILKVCSKRPDVLLLIDSVSNKGKGGNNNPLGLGGKSGKNIVNNDNVNIDNKQPQTGTGNTKTQAIRRLKKERPDLLEQFERGEISAHKAMVQAGFRRKKIQIDTCVDYVENVIKTIKNNCDEVFIDALIKGLS